MKSLVIDLGGTKARMALCSAQKGVDYSTILDLPSRDYKSLEEAILAYLSSPQAQMPPAIEAVAVGVAGPIVSGKAEVTNLGWEFTADQIKRCLKKYEVKKVGLINDLEAFAWGVVGLNQSNLAAINKGNHQEGNKVVVAAGTGLGMAGMANVEGRCVPFATEGGHSSFAPSAGDSDFLRFLSEKYKGHVSFERVVSGKFGFENILEYQSRCADVGNELQELKGDVGPQVYQLALRGNELALEVVDKFFYYYGVVAGNFALMHKACGGVFIAGGIAPKMKKLLLERQSFMDGFLNKGRFSDFMSTLPVHLVEDDHCALDGLNRYIEQVLQGEC